MYVCATVCTLLYLDRYSTIHIPRNPNSCASAVQLGSSGRRLWAKLDPVLELNNFRSPAHPAPCPRCETARAEICGVARLFADRYIPRAYVFPSKSMYVCTYMPPLTRCGHLL